jgi:hypothetical protein
MLTRTLVAECINNLLQLNESLISYENKTGRQYAPESMDRLNAFVRAVRKKHMQEGEARYTGLDREFDIDKENIENLAKIHQLIAKEDKDSRTYLENFNTTLTKLRAAEVYNYIHYLELQKLDAILTGKNTEEVIFLGENLQGIDFLRRVAKFPEAFLELVNKANSEVLVSLLNEGTFSEFINIDKNDNYMSNNRILFTLITKLPDESIDKAIRSREIIIPSSNEQTSRATTLLEMTLGHSDLTNSEYLISRGSTAALNEFFRDQPLLLAKFLENANLTSVQSLVNRIDLDVLHAACISKPSLYTILVLKGFKSIIPGLIEKASPEEIDLALRASVTVPSDQAPASFLSVALAPNSREAFIKKASTEVLNWVVAQPEILVSVAKLDSASLDALLQKVEPSALEKVLQLPDGLERMTQEIDPINFQKIFNKVNPEALGKIINQPANFAATIVTPVTVMPDLVIQKRIGKNLIILTDKLSSDHLSRAVTNQLNYVARVKDGRTTHRNLPSIFRSLLAHTPQTIMAVLDKLDNRTFLARFHKEGWLIIILIQKLDAPSIKKIFARFDSETIDLFINTIENENYISRTLLNFIKIADFETVSDVFQKSSQESISSILKADKFLLAGAASDLDDKTFSLLIEKSSSEALLEAYNYAKASKYPTFFYPTNHALLMIHLISEQGDKVEVTDRDRQAIKNYISKLPENDKRKKQLYSSIMTPGTNLGDAFKDSLGGFNMDPKEISVSTPPQDAQVSERLVKIQSKILKLCKDYLFHLVSKKIPFEKLTAYKSTEPENIYTILVSNKSDTTQKVFVDCRKLPKELFVKNGYNFDKLTHVLSLLNFLQDEFTTDKYQAAMNLVKSQEFSTSIATSNGSGKFFGLNNPLREGIVFHKQLVKTLAIPLASEEKKMYVAETKRNNSF